MSNNSKTAIGEFNIQMINLSNNTVRLWTNGQTNSVVATKWFNDIIRGREGIVEIEEVTTLQDCVILVLSETVTTKKQAGTVAKSFLRLVAREAEKLDEHDIGTWRDADQTLSAARVQEAMASGSPVRWPFDGGGHDE